MAANAEVLTLSTRLSSNLGKQTRFTAINGSVHSGFEGALTVLDMPIASSFMSHAMRREVWALQYQSCDIGLVEAVTDGYN